MHPLLIRSSGVVAGVTFAWLCAGGAPRFALQAQHAAPANLVTPLGDPVVNAPDAAATDTQSTSAIVLGAGSTVIAAFLDTAINTGTNKHQVAWSRSTSGGATWTDHGAVPSAPGGEFGAPFLARDPASGTIFLTATEFPGVADSALPFYTSNDDGQSWSAPVNAMPGFGGGDRLSVAKIAVDTFDGTGKGHIYVAAFNAPGGGMGSKAAGVYLSASIDGGATFTVAPGPLQAIGGVPQFVSGPTVVVGKDHAVYVFWFANQNSSPQIRFTKSIDLGQTFAPNQLVAPLTGAANGDLGLEFVSNSWPQAAVNPASGAIYVAVNDANGLDRGDVFIAASGNGGADWDDRNILNTDAHFGGHHDQFTPSIAVTPDGRHAMISWYDRRTDPANARIERWGFIATFADPADVDSEVALSPNFRISSGSWLPVSGQDPFIGAGAASLYEGLTADDHFFYAAWSDTRLADAVHAHQPDIRVAKIPVWAPAAFDADRDQLADRTVFRPSTGLWYTALSTGGFSALPWGQAGDLDVPADFDGDGAIDQAVFRPSTGAWYVHGSSGVIGASLWGQNGDVPLAGDVDGLSLADLVVWRPASGTWYINLPEQGTNVAIPWGQAGDIPRLADFDGDGSTDLVIYRPADGVWWIYFPRYRTYTSIRWGAPGDIPLAGDFDGDGTADAAVFRPGTGTWYVRRSTDGSLLAMNWGLAGDVPIAADFDGDGRSDITVFRPSDGVWYTSYSSGGFAAMPWGINGDQPSGR